MQFVKGVVFVFINFVSYTAIPQCGAKASPKQIIISATIAALIYFNIPCGIAKTHMKFKSGLRPYLHISKTFILRTLKTLLEGSETDPLSQTVFSMKLAEQSWVFPPAKDSRGLYRSALRAVPASFHSFFYNKRFLGRFGYTACHLGLLISALSSPQ